MDLDAGLTRRLVLAGTVAFPKPYPSIGAISFETGSLKLSPSRAAKPEDLIVIQERAGGSGLVKRIVRRSDVAAIFVPGARSCEKEFRMSRKRWVNDPRRGEWFLDADINPDDVRTRLDIIDADVMTSDSVLRGIVFVSENRPVITVTHEATLAISARDLAKLDEPCGRDGRCTCDKYHTR